ncbi:MAG TPA: adenylate/guanylate cyclase domain-containing protein [Oligoflexus sp.]|uniref:adenylate/guanylate cyclase domain-containing protein n=1 Tax=Oligoflexus sp. TaxID=1971216 RepID=UPI002D30749D|nr:adenylate/guanylate cyclase domain-containing protein [Oligoflexus sp.]HYX37528.1 adenylate/guanylate cyclase domain-containing protein [Oligoflexus sp.]
MRALNADAYLLREMVRRQAVLALIFGLAFGLYGVTSFEVIQSFKPELTLWDNLWPRLLLNSLPYFLLAWISHRRIISDRATARLGMLAFPGIFMVACMIHVWPLMSHGHSGIYGFVHGPNVFIIVITLLILSPPASYLLQLIIGFTLCFALPVVGILINSGNIVLLQLFANDMIVMMPVTFFLARKIHRTQRRLVLAEHDLKQRVTPFLGQYVASALYENRYDLLRDRKTQGLILSLDIRGFSRLMRDLGPVELNEFLRLYYGLIGRIVHAHGGHVHKSMGDGHLISFGVMDLPDLSDIPDLAEAVVQAEQRRKNDLHAHALKAFFEIEKEFIALLQQFPRLVPAGLGLGGGMAFGDVHLAIYGDEAHKREFEISGETVVLSSRLEQYTKVLRAENPDWQHGIFSVVVTCELPPRVHQESGSRSWQSFKTLTTPIPDFPQVKSICYANFVTEPERAPMLSRTG